MDITLRPLNSRAQSKGFFQKAIIICVAAIMITTSVQAQDQNPSVLRHVVLFSFKANATAEDIKKVEKAFASLPDAIPQIKDYEWGTNNSPEKLNQGLTHCFLLTFASEKDRDDYLVHPEHKKFGGVVGPHIDKVTVVDYWSK